MIRNFIEENIPSICGVLFFMLMVGAIALGIYADKSSRASTYVYGELLSGKVVRVEYWPTDRQELIGLYGQPEKVPASGFKRIWKEEEKHAKR